MFLSKLICGTLLDELDEDELDEDELDEDELDEDELDEDGLDEDGLDEDELDEGELDEGELDEGELGVFFSSSLSLLQATVPNTNKRLKDTTRYLLLSFCNNLEGCITFVG